jgi:hypothetical protein
MRLSKTQQRGDRYTQGVPVLRRLIVWAGGFSTYPGCPFRKDAMTTSFISSLVHNDLHHQSYGRRSVSLFGGGALPEFWAMTLLVIKRITFKIRWWRWFLERVIVPGDPSLGKTREERDRKLTLLLDRWLEREPKP